MFASKLVLRTPEIAHCIVELLSFNNRESSKGLFVELVLTISKKLSRDYRGCGIVVGDWRHV